VNAPATTNSKYRAVEREADELGRIIGVRRLRPSEKLRVSGLTPDLDGFDQVEEQVTGPDGQMVKTGNVVPFSHRLPLIIAASVCELNEAKLGFPKTRQDLDGRYDLLDDAGLAAASRAWSRLLASQPSQEEIKADAKN
jgi:hypothetical protein